MAAVIVEAGEAVSRRLGWSPESYSESYGTRKG
jgi:hypothetical protein